MSIQTEIDRLKNAKSNIAQAISDKGGIYPTGTIETYAQAVMSIPSGCSKYATTIGDNTAKNFTITHNLETEDIIVNGHSLIDTKDNLWLEYTILNANSISVTFQSPPKTNGVRIIIVG